MIRPYPPPGGPPTLWKVAVTTTSARRTGIGALTATKRPGSRGTSLYPGSLIQAVECESSGQRMRLSVNPSSSKTWDAGSGAVGSGSPAGVSAAPDDSSWVGLDV